MTRIHGVQLHLQLHPAVDGEWQILQHLQVLDGLAAVVVADMVPQKRWYV